MCDVQDLKCSMSFCGTVNEEKFVNIQSEITLIKDDILKRNTVNYADTEKLLEHSKKLVDLEDRSRRNNLRIDGVKESKGETWEQCEQKVKAIFNGQLRIEEEIEIDRAHRIEKNPGRNDDRPSTIVLRCTRYKQKEKIRKLAKRLKGTGIYINDDYSVVTRKHIEELTPTVFAIKEKERLIT